MVGSGEINNMQKGYLCIQTRPFNTIIFKKQGLLKHNFKIKRQRFLCRTVKCNTSSAISLSVT
uniref:Uncharacterized protein n=1 Tax=Anguilla anguilla TaxID=7936 RepID=A0A0E9PRT2_ANGAN